jgi:hypothetical protein
VRLERLRRPGWRGGRGLVALDRGAGLELELELGQRRDATGTTGASCAQSVFTRRRMSGKDDPLEQLASAADRQDVSIAASSSSSSADDGASPPGADMPASSPNLAAIAFLLTTFRTLAGVMLKVQTLELTLNDSNVQACASVLAPVADKYGIDLAGAFSGPEAAALMVAGPILWEAARQLNLELKARRAKPVDAAPADDASSSTSTGAVAGA